jgi:hypothetical protein
MPTSTHTDLHATVARLSHPDYIFELVTEGGVPFLRVVCPRGVNTQDPTQSFAWRGRKWRLSPHMTAGEVAQTALLASLAAAEHEMRELFKVDGVAVFGPHWDLDALVDAYSAKTRPLPAESPQQLYAVPASSRA